MDCWHSKNPEAHATFMATQEVPAEAEVPKDGEDGELDGDKTVNEDVVSSASHVPPASKEAHPATDCSGNHFSETVLDVRLPSEPEKIYKLLYQTPHFQETVNNEMKLTGRTKFQSSLF